jgi:spore germination protein KB
MSTHARISHQQLICTLAISQHVGMLVLLPALVARYGGHGAWLAPVLSLAAGAVPTSLLTGLLIRLHPGKSIAAIAEACLGRIPGKLFTLVQTLGATFVTGLLLRHIMDFVPLGVLPETPSWFVGLTALLVGAYAAACGAEVIARFASPLLVLDVLVILSMPLFLLGTLEPIRGYPLTEAGILGLWRGAWPAVGWFAEIWFTMDLVALLDRPSLATRSLVIGSSIGGFLLMVFTALTIMVFGPDLTAYFIFPAYSLIQQIAVGEFLERLEILLIVLWLLSMIAKLGANLWAASVNAARLFGLAGDRPLLPLAMGLSFAVPYLFPNIFFLFNRSVQFWTAISLTLSILMPGALLIATWLQRRKARPCGHLDA